MELKPNMYVRLNCNYELGIGKIIREIDEDNFIKAKFKDDFECSVPMFMISKASHNIIDLIQKDDFVNGEKVSSIQYDGVGFEHINCVQTICEFDSLDNEFYTKTYFNKDIKSIVTSQQFESMSYKVN